MKKIIMSLAMIVAVGAVVVGGTGAFFSDVETSEGNTFTAGSLDLKVDSQAYYNGMVCSSDGKSSIWADDGEVGGYVETEDIKVGDYCNGTWAATNLGASHQFFGYEDLKPGDWGRNRFSLHVFDNDAYVCAVIDNMVDLENDQTEPELEDGDNTAVDGELSGELHFFAWADVDGDSKWDGEATEHKLFSNESGPASDVLNGRVYPMYTPTNGMGALAGDTDTNIGMYWCYGEITVDYTESTLACNGQNVSNVSQTDSMTADISFYVEQARHNDNFDCSNVPVSSVTAEATENLSTEL